MFLMNEDLRDPVNTIADLSTASVKMAKNAVVDYLKTKHDPELIRNYLVGGKERNGAFVIYEIAWDTAQRKALVVERRLNNHAEGMRYQCRCQLERNRLCKKP